LRILVLGASGFIGSRAAAALRAAGHEAVSTKLDFTRALRPEDWLSSLRGIDAVLNAVGIIRERGRRSFGTLHYAAPRALFDACRIAGVRRVVQISALGADESARSRFHRTKRRADEYLAGLELDWAIVQPSIVFGDGGASARLLALLAALPLTPVPGDGRQNVQPIHVDDLVEALVKLLSVPMRIRLHAVGPRALTLREWLRVLRAQMGLGRARFVQVPLWLVPVERETLQMLERGSTASPETITQLLRRAPRDPNDFLDARSGAGLALRARLDWVVPLLRFSIGAVWIASGVVSLGIYPLEESLAMLSRVGLAGRAALAALYGAAALDIVLGIATFVTNRKGLWRAQIALIAAYTAIISAFLPELWLHPFGPVLKNLPMLAALVALHELAPRR
jgi:uncharacterized protein YbjT (DUF2867 family)